MKHLLQLMVKPGGQALPRGGEMESNSCWCAGLSPIVGDKQNPFHVGAGEDKRSEVRELK